MSAQLKKIQEECAKLEEEVAMHKSSEPVAAACEKIVTQMVKTPDPFCAGEGGPPNPWHTSNASEGGCCVVS